MGHLVNIIYNILETLWITLVSFWGWAEAGMKAGDVQKPVRNPKFRTTTFTFVEPLATEEYDPITQTKNIGDI